MAHIAVLGTLDTKGDEHQFIAENIRRLGHHPILIDVGSGTEPKISPQISRREVALIAGLDAHAKYPDQETAVAAMSNAAGKVLNKLLQEKRIQGVISVGGQHGTEIATAGMRALPIGIPKVMVSSIPQGTAKNYVGHRDVIIFPSIADVNGVNQMLRPILAQASGAICGMAEFAANLTRDEKPLVVVSVAPQCAAGIDRAVAIIEGAGYEVLRIPSDGVGGHSLQSLVDSNLASGVLDMSLREFSEHITGGPFSAGAGRLDAAALTGVPAVIVPGCVDMTTIPEESKGLPQYRERTFQKLNDKFRLMRTTPQECALIGKAIAEKLNASSAPTTVMLPLRGVSALSSPGKPFHDPEADFALFRSLRQSLRKGLQVREMRSTINDMPFAEACARALLGNIRAYARNHENLKKVEFFENESEAFLREITPLLETEVYLPGDYIIKQDEVADSMFFIAEGSAEVLISNKKIAKLGNGAPFGEMALVSGERRNASIRALEYCEVHKLSKEHFAKMRSKNPAFDERVRTVVKQRAMFNLHSGI